MGFDVHPCQVVKRDSKQKHHGGWIRDEMNINHGSVMSSFPLQMSRLTFHLPRRFCFLFTQERVDV